MSNSLQPRGSVNCQAPLSMGFPGQEYRSGLPFPSPGDLLDRGIEQIGDYQGLGVRGVRSVSLLLLSHFSRVRLCDPIDGSPPGFASLGFSRQEHWSGLPFPAPGDLPDPGTELVSLRSLHWQVGSLPPSHQGGPNYNSRYYQMRRRVASSLKQVDI